MTTAEKLKSLTDRSLFEAIANSVLRHKHTELRDLIVGGLNPKGETIKGSPDSFVEVSSGVYALVEHTTNDSNLERKWLFDRTEYKGKRDPRKMNNGDLISAIEKANEIRHKVPAAKFTIYLTSNHNVDTNLWLKVSTKANSAGVSAKLLELSNISEFLDTDSTGQYLRKKYLNIDYELLSKEALLELQESNLNQYRTESFINTAVVEHGDLLSEFVKFIDESQKYLTFLVAESGFGKSTMCYSSLKLVTETGRNAFRVTPELVDEAIDLKQLVEVCFKKIKPNIFWGDEAINLIFNTGFTVVVDDINTYINPTKLIDKLIAWGIEAKQAITKIHIVCPIWPKHFNSINNREKKEDGFDYYLLGTPTRQLAKMIIAKALIEYNTPITELQIDEIVIRTESDPLLIGLYLQLIKNDNSFTISQSRDVIKSFVRDKLHLACQSLSIPLSEGLLRLREFGSKIVIERNMQPSYRELNKWYETNQGMRDFIDRLSSLNELFLFNENGGIQFRHDRIREYFLIEGFNLIAPNLRENVEVFSDPFFAEQIGTSISEVGLADDDIALLLKKNPESVFQALKYLQDDSKVEYFNRIIRLITIWKASEDYPKSTTSIMDGIIWCLLGSDIKDFERVSENLPQTSVLLLAQLRNGSASGGIKYFASMSEFEPTLNDTLRDSILQHVLQYRGATVKAELCNFLTDTSLTLMGRKGAYLLCGYLNDKNLSDALKTNWNRNRVQELYPYYLWAMLHICSQDSRDDLADCLEFFKTLPDEGENQRNFPEGIRNKMLYSFHHCRWQLEHEQIEIIDSLYEQSPVLLEKILSLIDHPKALARTLTSISLILDKHNARSEYLAFPTSRWDFRRSGYRLSDQSLVYLFNTWTNKNNGSRLRKLSFKTWVDNERASTVIEHIQTIKQDDKELYDHAVRKRAILGDQSVLIPFTTQLRRNPMLLGILHHIWEEQCVLIYQSVIEKYKSTFKSNPDLLDTFADVLFKIPEQNAEQILIDNWEDFRGDEVGIQAALYIASPITKELAAKEIQTSQSPASLFRFIDQRFGCMNIDMSNRLSISKLEALQPYFGLIDPSDLKWFAEHTIRKGHQNWMNKNLTSHLAPQDKKYFNPTIEDLVQEIDQELKINNPFIAKYWVESLDRRRQSIETAKSAIKLFIKSDLSPQGFSFALNFIGFVGNRKDLYLLDDCLVGDTDTNFQAEARANIRYAVMRRSLG